MIGLINIFNVIIISSFDLIRWKWSLLLIKIINIQVARSFSML